MMVGKTDVRITERNRSVTWQVGGNHRGSASLEDEVGHTRKESNPPETRKGACWQLHLEGKKIS